jgi:hypothetical protein
MGALGVAIAIAGTLAAAAPAQAQEGLELRPNRLGNALKERVAELDGELPNVGVGSVLADANRHAKSNDGAACNDAALEGGAGKPNLAKSFCFEPGDNDTPDWYPQGVTTVADAQDDQKWGENKPILVSWYDHKADSTAKGVRVSFLDSRTGDYRHVLLAYPVINSYGNPSYESVRTDQDGGKSLHAGGITRYGNFLYVADTNRGFRVFDMRHIYDLGKASNGTTKSPSKIGRHDGTYYGHGYRYVMPQVASWTADSSPMHFSFTSLDRSGKDSIVAGEYCDSDGEYCDGKTHGNVAAWEIAGAVDGNGEQITDTDYRWKPTDAHTMQETNIQGAARFEGRWYLSQSRGGDSNGALHRTKQNPGEDLVSEAAQPLPIGPEDLSTWPAESAHALWTVSEHPGKRMLYSVTPD